MVRSRAWPTSSTSPARATSPRSPTSPSCAVKLMTPQQLYRALGAPALELAHDRLHPGPARTGRRWATSATRSLGPGVVLRRRGARATQFTGLVDGLRGPERGGVPDHPAGRRGAPRPALQPLLRAGARPTTARSRTASTGAARTSTSRSSSSSTATSSRPTAAWSSDPRDIEAKVDFVTTYHMVIEGTLALTGQYFLTDVLRAQRHPARLPRGLPQDLPGRAPPRRLRHLVPQAGRGRPRAARGGSRTAAGELSHRRRRAGAARLTLGEDYEFLGYTSEEINDFAFTALTRRLKVIGVTLGLRPVNPTCRPRRRSLRSFTK